MEQETEIQRQYYKITAEQYGALHMQPDDEHYFALSWLASIIEHFGYRSLLDVGSGTGRAISYFSDRLPGLEVLGIEPSAELRDIGYRRGIAREVLVEGNALDLQYPDGAFDVVCEFGVLHHIRNPGRAVSEMLRVARKAVFVSDDNHYGSGSPAMRMVKQALAAVGMWGPAYRLKTGGKGFRVTESDGLAYPYSVFDDFRLIRRRCAAVHVMNTRDGGISPYRSAGNIALLGIKRPE